MTDKLKEGELLERLERIVRPAMDYLKYWENKDEQAYQQIKERIKDYAEHQELTANYIDIVIDLYDQLERKKPIATKEFVEKWEKVFPVLTQADVIFNKNNIKQMLKEAGVRVVGK
ncbi:hypothetical protein ES703_82278 [subsurface metagenome]